jgi:hypothetical protein
MLQNFPNIGYNYYRFGSKDSKDIDILIDYPSATGEEKDSQLIKSIKEQHSLSSDWNINLVRIEDGIVTKSIPSKGSPDSVNNSLYETYHLHSQNFKFPLDRKVKRDLNEAIERCLNAIFIFYLGTSNHEISASIPKDVKNGKRPILERLELLKEIDFEKLSYDSLNENLNAYKSITFRVGQTISLIDGIEIYTKQDLVYYHPELTAIIKREEISSYSIINKKVNELKEKLKIKVLNYTN